MRASTARRSPNVSACELGYALEPAAESKAAERTPIAASSTLSDREKFEKLGFGQPADPSKPDQFTAMFADSTIDSQTGALLGRHIAEERDSTRLFSSCYEQLCAETNGSATARGNGIEDRLARIEQCLGDLANSWGSWGHLLKLGATPMPPPRALRNPAWVARSLQRRFDMSLQRLVHQHFRMSKTTATASSSFS